MKKIANQNKITEHRQNKCNACFFFSFCFTTPDATTSTILKRQQNIKRHQHLCRENSAFNSLYIVKNGLLKAYTFEIDGRERVANFYFPGEVIGFEAIHPSSYPFSISALQDTAVCEISFDTLLNFIQTYPLLQQQLLALTSHRIMLNYYVTHIRAEQRLSGFLLNLATRLQSHSSSCEFHLPMTYQTIADHLGLAAETIIRLMKRFSQQGLITVNHKNIKLCNIENLKNL